MKVRILADREFFDSLDCRMVPVITDLEQAQRIKRTHTWCSRNTCNQAIAALAFIEAVNG